MGAGALYNVPWHILKDLTPIAQLPASSLMIVGKTGVPANNIKELIAWLKANPGTLLLIEGHTDERGTSEYNLGLGDLRASAAKRYMMDQGVASARMVAISYGKERPLCTEHTESCWARNRRAHFLAKPR